MEKENTDKIAQAYTRLSEKLYAVALARLHDRHMAQDMVNAAFVEALRHRIWWCAQNASVRERYLIAACERLCEAYLRRERLCARLPYDEQKDKGNGNAGAGTGALARIELREGIERCMEMLSGDERLILCKRYFENYSTKRLGELMGISRANVLQRLVRARKKLKALLERGGISPH